MCMSKMLSVHGQLLFAQAHVGRKMLLVEGLCPVQRAPREADAEMPRHLAASDPHRVRLPDGLHGHSLRSDQDVEGDPDLLTLEANVDNREASAQQVAALAAGDGLQLDRVEPHDLARAKTAQAASSRMAERKAEQDGRAVGRFNVAPGAPVRVAGVLVRFVNGLPSTAPRRAGVFHVGMSGNLSSDVRLNAIWDQRGALLPVWRPVWRHERRRGVRTGARRASSR